MRDAFFDELTSLAQADPRIVYLTADLGFKLWDDFAARCPGRFFNMGVSEANMVSVAAGLALQGFRPVTYSIVPFATIRCLEQIRNDVCGMGLPVVIVGVGGGYAYGANGPTHHGIDDVAAMRTLPDMTVLCPCDPRETRAALRAAVAAPGPVYLRLGRNREPNIGGTGSEGDFQLGIPRVVRRGHGLAILACGPIIEEALAAGEDLAQRGLDPLVASVHTVKPIEGLVEFIRQSGVEQLLVVEEHGPAGGLGEALAAALADWPHPPRLTRLSAPDAFVHRSGSQKFLRHSTGIDRQAIVNRILECTHLPTGKG